MSVLALALLSGCSVGGGDGAVVGTLWIADCNYGESLAPRTFDLRPNFFAGEPVSDEDANDVVRRSLLHVRLQRESGTLDTSNSLDFIFEDVRAAGRLFAARDAIAVASDTECSETECTSRDSLVRSQLRVYNTCPDTRSALTALDSDLRAQTPDVPGSTTCLIPSRNLGPGCPAVNTAALDELCASEFGDPDLAIRVEQELGGGACLYLCEWGSLPVGASAAEIEDFSLGFGDTIAGLFSLRLVDERAFVQETCAQASGSIHGMFRFRLVRSRAAQTFP